MTAATTPQTATSPVSQRVPLWKTVLQWMIPNRADQLNYLGALIVVVALIQPTLDGWGSFRRGVFNDLNLFPATLMMIAGCIAAIGCAKGWRKLDRQSTRHLLVGCALGLAAFGFGIFEYFRSALGSFAGIGTGFDEHWIAAYGFGWGGALVLGVMLAVFCIFWFLTSIFAFGFGKLSGTQAAEFSRVKLMIVLAVILFVIAKIQSFFFPQGFAAGMDWNGPAGTRVLFQSLGVLAGSIALFILPSWLLTRDIRSRWKWSLCIVILGAGFFWLLVMTATNRNLQNYSSEQIMLKWYAFQFCFLVGLMAIQPKYYPKFNQTESSSSAPAVEAAKPRQFNYPTIWSIAPVALIVALITSMFLVDTGVLLEFRDWDLARKSKRIARSTDYQVQIYPGVWGGSTAVVDLGENAESDVLDCLVNETISFGNLHRINTEIDTGRFSGAGIANLNLTNSKITPRQLEDIASTCTYLSMNKVGIVGAPRSASLDMLTHLTVDSSSPGEIGGLLRSIKSAKSLLSIRVWVSESLNQNDLDAIVEISQIIPVELDWLGLKSLVEMDYQSKLPMRNIMIPRLDRVQNNMTEALITDLDRQAAILYLFQNDISVGFDKDNDLRNFWDLVFAKGSNGNPDFQQKVLREIQQKSDLVDVFKKYHLAFGENENGDITDLFIPQATSIFGKLPAQMKEFQSIETLSFDPLWIIQDNPIHRVWNQTPFKARQPEDRITGIGFDQLKNLKRLDLGSGAIVVDQFFLNRIPQIEHLDIHFETGLRARVDFSVCKNLETLVYFGTPPKATAKQLSALKNLKTVTVIDELDGTLGSEQKRANLIAAINNAKVEIVSMDEYYPLPPQKFIDHVKARGIEIRKKRFGKTNAIPEKAN